MTLDAREKYPVALSILGSSSTCRDSQTVKALFFHSVWTIFPYLWVRSTSPWVHPDILLPWTWRAPCRQWSWSHRWGRSHGWNQSHGWSGKRSRSHFRARWLRAWAHRRHGQTAWNLAVKAPLMILGSYGAWWEPFQSDGSSLGPQVCINLGRWNHWHQMTSGGVPTSEFLCEGGMPRPYSFWFEFEFVSIYIKIVNIQLLVPGTRVRPNNNSVTIGFLTINHQPSTNHWVTISHQPSTFVPSTINQHLSTIGVLGFRFRV